MTDSLLAKANDMRILAATLHHDADAAPGSMSLMCEKMRAAADALNLAADGIMEELRRLRAA